jgi:thiol-disulfide isomerase/thioredoxin
MTLLRFVALCISVGLGLGVTAGCARGTKPSSEAQAWQERRLRTLEGVETSVADYRGKVVLLDFWASWCEPCRYSMPFYRQLQQDFEPRGFTVLGVNLDENASAARSVVEREKLTFPILWDPTATLPDLLQVDVMPTALVLDTSGEIRHRHSGFVTGDETRLREQLEAMLREVPVVPASAP